jgi:hypothetical protein
MSRKSQNNGKMPILIRRLSINKINKNNLIGNEKNYISIGSLTPRFNKIYSKYIKSKQRTIYPNISSILNDYRSEKLNKLSEQEAMKEEIGEEIKKYKDMHDILKRKGHSIDKEKYFNNYSKHNKKQLKENRGIILDTFDRFENRINTIPDTYSNDKEMMKIVSPYKIFKINKNFLEERIKNKLKNKTAFYFNRKKMIDLIDTTIKEKPKTRDGKKIKIKDCWDYFHLKINSYCDMITDDSIRVKINGRKTLDRFNNSWNKYKIIQKFKNPETKKHIYEDI